MNPEKEREKLVELLKIPVSEVRFSDFFCEIYYHRELIGMLPTTMSSSGIHYEVSTTHLKSLNWPKVCYLNALELTDAVAKELEGKSAFQIIPYSFRRLFIEDPEKNLFASFECQFNNHHWVVIDEKILKRE